MNAHVIYQYSPLRIEIYAIYFLLELNCVSYSSYIVQFSLYAYVPRI